MNPTDRESIIKILTKEIPYLRERFGVERIGLFGSFTRGDASEESDVDIMVSLPEPLGFSFIELADYLEAKLVRKVDLVSAKTLEFGSADPKRAHIAREIWESLIYI